MIKGCVFDFGGVMTTMTMPERVRPIVQELGIPWSAIEAGFAKYRRQMDGDLISMDEMYDRTFADAGISITWFQDRHPHQHVHGLCASFPHSFP